LVRGIAGTSASAYVGGETVNLKIENSSIAVANTASPFVVGVAATGTITPVAPSVHYDEDYITISDGNKTATFVIDKVGDGTNVYGGIPLDISADAASVDAADVGLPLAYAIDDMYKITVVDSANFAVCPFASTSGVNGTYNTVADANSNFAGSVISTSGDAFQGIVRHIDGNNLYVQVTTGSAPAIGTGVDNAPFSAVDTLITRIEKVVDISATWSSPDIELTALNTGSRANVQLIQSGGTFTIDGLSGGADEINARGDYIARLNKNLEPIDEITFSDNEILKVYARNPGKWGQKIYVSVANPYEFSSAYVMGDSEGGLTFASEFDYRPLESKKEIAVAVIEEDNLGNKVIVEKYIGSLTEGVLDDNQNSYFIEDIVANQSSFIFIDVNDKTSASEATQTYLTSSIDNSVTTIPVISTTAFPSKGRIKIENEWVYYTGKTSTTFTGCVRGADGSTANSHASALTVYENNMPSVVTEKALEGGADAIYSRESIRDEILLVYDLYSDPEDITIDIVIDGANVNDVTIQQYIIDNICEVRRDCIAVLTVPYSSIDHSLKSQQINGMIDFRTSTGTYSGIGLNRNSSYAALYGNWKYQYDKYTDKFRWLPLSSDMAGIMAFTDDTTDPWWAPAGLNRGQMKNVSRFKVQPVLGDRDLLYKDQINPVLEFRGDGPVVWGQKTMLTRPSAFDRINVRRLFLVLERAVSIAAKFYLFEFNDRFTRTQLVNMIEPFLREVRGRRGIQDYLIICDESNNPPTVIMRNELVCDIYIKPNYVVEFLRLNFIATNLGTSFQELLKV
jgi:hypothetical protein